MCRTKYYRNAYGCTAKCVQREGGYWDVRVYIGDVSDQRLCADLVHAKRFMRQYGSTWTEVERWA